MEQKVATNDLLTDISILKNWYLLTHEKYFKSNLVLDRYDRIGQENLSPEFFTILKVPIADVLKKTLQNRLGCAMEVLPKIYLTSDFDILNVWDVWDVWKTKDLLREIVLNTKNRQFKRLYKTVSSYFLSCKNKKINGYLNEKMYCFDSDFINIGFFISTTTNEKYDGTINYQNEPVKQYIEELKSKNVVFGLQTNYNTKDNLSSIVDQQGDFENLFLQKTTYNRHHYLRFLFPDFLKTLEVGGIEKDFSLYFPESMLFRAGTCSAYFAWNQIENRPYKTLLIPTTIMDGTFSDYLFCSHDEALKSAKNKLDLTLKYSDSLVLLWHNRSTYKFCNIENNYHPELIKELIDYLKASYLNKY